MTSTHGDVVLTVLPRTRSVLQNHEVESLFLFRMTVGKSGKARSAHLEAVQAGRNRTYA